MISIVIPAYNAEKTVGRCVDAIKGQSDAELIVVDDGSGDNTANEAERHGAKVLRRPHAGPAAARNAGLEAAKGEIVLFTDADCVPDGKWTENMARPFNDKSVAGVSGTYRTLNHRSATARFVGYEIEIRHRRMAKFGKIDFIGTFSAGYRTQLLRQFGGFDTGFRTSSAEDPDVSFRMADAGHRLVFEPSAFVWHPHPDSPIKYLKQKFQRGYWRVLLYKKHPSRMKGESYTPPTLFLETALTGLFAATLPLVPFFSWMQYVSAAAISAMLLINARFYAFMAKKEPVMGLYSVPMSIARNLAYGLGIASGLLRI